MNKHGEVLLGKIAQPMSRWPLLHDGGSVRREKVKGGEKGKGEEKHDLSLSPWSFPKLTASLGGALWHITCRKLR